MAGIGLSPVLPVVVISERCQRQAQRCGGCAVSGAPGALEAGEGLVAEDDPDDDGHGGGASHGVSGGCNACPGRPGRRSEGPPAGVTAETLTMGRSVSLTPAAMALSSR